MVPKLIRGASFKGAAAYLLHDIDAASGQRVAWTDVRNLASSNPETAWRVMAATALDADRLKERAGIKATGRKSAQSVLHLVLSWHPDEAASLDREQMLAAAEGALKAIGAGDRQALIIAHNDSAHPHLHILVNRVSSRDGRLLSSSKEKLKLSKWAQRYEEERGKIYCEDRVLNNEARARGEYTRAEKGIPWQIMKAERLVREAANDNPTKVQQLRAQLQEQVRGVGARMRAVVNRHAREWTEFEAAHIERRREIVQSFQRARAKARQGIFAEFRPLWRELRAREQEEAARLARDEATRLGRLRTVFRMIGTWRSAFEGDRLQAASGLWSALFSSEKRRELLGQEQTKRREALESRQRRTIRQAITPIHAEHRLRLHTWSRAFQADRSSLVLAHSADRAKLRAEWAKLRQDRAQAYAALRVSHENRQAFTQAATGQSYYDRLKAMAKAHREVAKEQTNQRDRDQERE